MLPLVGALSKGYNNYRSRAFRNQEHKRNMPLTCLKTLGSQFSLNSEIFDKTSPMLLVTNMKVLKYDGSISYILFRDGE